MGVALAGTVTSEVAPWLPFEWDLGSSGGSWQLFDWPGHLREGGALS